MEPDAQPGPAVGPQVIFGFDTEGTCTLSTGSGLEMLGLRSGELVGTNLFDLYADQPTALADIRRALSGETFTVEAEFEDRILWAYYEPVVTENGTMKGAIGVTTDVTEQRRIEREAREARRRASLLADLSAALTREVHNVATLLDVAARAVTEALGDVGVIWMPLDGEDDLVPRAVWPTDESGLRPGLGWPRPVAEPPSGPELIDHGTVVRAPLVSRGLLVGVMDVARTRDSGPFADDDLALVVDVAERCALALDNALLFEGQREAREDLVKFQALADASSDLIAISDEGGNVIYSNPRVQESGIDVFVDSVWLTVAGQIGDTMATAIRDEVTARGRWSGDLTLTLTDGEAVVQVDVFSLLHPDTGTGLGAAWIARDVTELRATEAALREANSDLVQFKALVEASPDFIAIAGLDGKVRYVNPGGRALIGMDPQVDVTTTSIPDYLTPEGLDASLNVEQPAVIANGHWEGESTLRNFRGPAIPVAIASFLMRDPETGEPFALATVQRDITERLAAETSLRNLADQRQALLTRLVVAQDDERARIAADVHDDPVQALAAVDLRLGLLERRLGEQSPGMLEVLSPVQRAVSAATDRLRALLFDLEPPDLSQGLTGAMHRAAGEIFEGSRTRWTVDGDQEPDVPDATRAVAYRIAKEALMNARRHAEATHVAVTVTGRSGGLEVTVTDDGIGLGHGPVRSSPGHRGIFTMRDRAEVAGGSCEIRNRSPRGTLVTLWLPDAPRDE
ncbi:MAG TPA: PAS domain S-box protein [Nocardioidaceae bacterium]|nr:PAS domain S-box protein [Nocardioidaceae bacterium]